MTYGGTDKDNDSCDSYGPIHCGNYDDDDFESRRMCCVCMRRIKYRKEMKGMNEEVKIETNEWYLLQVVAGRRAAGEGEGGEGDGG